MSSTSSSNQSSPTIISKLLSKVFTKNIIFSILSLSVLLLLITAVVIVRNTIEARDINASEEPNYNQHAQAHPDSHEHSDSQAHSDEWSADTKLVDLDEYVSSNQVSQNIIDKKQRVMLEPELIRFSAKLQDVVLPGEYQLVSDALSVWGITPLPNVGFSTYITTKQDNVLGVYIENEIAAQIKDHFNVNDVLQFQAYRLYNYAKGPRLLLVGVKALPENLKEQDLAQE
jgi:hypothetical protein